VSQENDRPPQGRGKNGKFERVIGTAESDAEAATLRAQGLTYRQIADRLGYVTESGAYKAVDRALTAACRDSGDALRILEVQRLDDLLRRAYEVLDRVHFAHSNGRLVRRRVVGPDGLWVVIGGDDDHPIYEEEDVIDDAPTLKAIDTVLKIQERRSRLLGLDRPTKHEVITLDAVDEMIAEAESELRAHGVDPDNL
jgi:hypothetical protein